MLDVAVKPSRPRPSLPHCTALHCTASGCVQPSGIRQTLAAERRSRCEPIKTNEGNPASWKRRVRVRSRALVNPGQPRLPAALPGTASHLLSRDSSADIKQRCVISFLCRFLPKGCFPHPGITLPFHTRTHTHAVTSPQAFHRYLSLAQHLQFHTSPGR